MPNPTNPTDVLLHERDARGVVTLTLNRPQAFNALSEALLDALQAQIDALMEDDAARVVILRDRKSVV
jgi:enoyl-CoA hydratase/carnithine racemase